MPGRKYTAGSVYRYGFNGREKSDEVYGEGNVYDFGERIQNARLGRWFSIDKYENIGWSPYNFAVNNPIQYIDEGGNIQPDPKGNIIFTLINRSAISRTNFTSIYIKELAGKSTAFVQVQQGYIWTNSGNPVLVYKILSVTIQENVSVGDGTSNTKTIYTTYDINDPKAAAYKTNCFGRTLTDGQYFIPDFPKENVGAQVILDEEFKQIKANAISGKGIVAGDIIDVGEKYKEGFTLYGSHLLKATGEFNSKGEMLYESQFALDPAGNQKMTLKEAVAYGNSNIVDPDESAYSTKQIKIYRKKGEDLIRNPRRPLRSEKGDKAAKAKAKDKLVQQNDNSPLNN